MKSKLAPDEFVSPYTGRRRRKAWKTWVWDRQGTHAGFGGVIGLTWLVPLLAGNIWLILALIASVAVFQTIATVVFLTYEITEGWRIQDQAYVDIGGFLLGYCLSSVPVIILLAVFA